MKYKSSAYTGFMQHAENQHTRERRERVEKSNKKHSLETFLLGRHIVRKVRDYPIELNTEEESHFPFFKIHNNTSFLKHIRPLCSNKRRIFFDLFYSKA